MVDTAADMSIKELENKITEYYDTHGFLISRKASLTGKSGIQHTFDFIAKRDDGITSYTIAVNIDSETEHDARQRSIFKFSNNAYDAGIHDRVLIAMNPLETDLRELAQTQRIQAIGVAQIETEMAAGKKVPSDINRPSGFETKAKLIETLAGLGYRVEKDAKLSSRSRMVYTFDILAQIDMGLVPHSLGIDVIDTTGTLGLERLLVFEAKCFDAGVDHKAIYTTAELTAETQQFAQYQHIRIFETTPPSVPAGETDSKKPGQEGKPAAPGKGTGKQLRQSIQAEALQLIPEVMARRYSAIPITITGNILQVAMANPTDIFALEAFAAQSRKRIKPVAATPEEVREAIDFNYKAYGEIESALSKVSGNEDFTDDKIAIAAIDAPLTQALNLIIDEAAKARTSDIHIEPEENRLRVRYRIDGTLHDTMSLPLNIHRPLISRIKILASMNIADHYRPQDGQFSTDSKGRHLDIRVATVPTVHGEMAVLRLLDKSMASRGLKEVGFLPEALDKYQKMLKHPYGMILISGPTGSGKTTTLYASLDVIDTMSRNVITIEDPAEYRIKDINQIQVNTQAGITFASGLRSILRLDPNVILVGEIRDSETAGIAVQAALTGHLMLSSIHANDSVGALFRLVDLGIEPFLIASSIIGIVAQRMVRRICPDCSRLIEAPVSEQLTYEKVLGEKRTQFRYGTGCNTCSFTGYRGRTGLFEILLVSDRMRSMLLEGAGKVEIRNQALKEGLVYMMKDGMMKVKEGSTTISEVLRATYTQE